MSVLITSAESLKALTIVRSLGRHGVSVTTGSHVSSPLASYSRYSMKNIIYPSPIKNPDDFTHSIYKFLENNPHDVLMPVHSNDTILLNKRADAFSKVTKLPFHRIDLMERINDKASLVKVARESDIPVPRTWIPERPDFVKEIASEIHYPAVIKLRDRTSSTGQSYANSPDELVSLFNNTILNFKLTPAEYPIIQEYIKGEGYGVSLLFNHGDIRARFTHKRIREFPASGGPSTCRISTSHPLMEKYATQLLSAFSWHGIAMVEFILSPDGIPYLLEVNPRFWGSINQAVQSGIDFPYLLYQMAIEGDVKPVFSYRKGVVTRNCFLDICSYLQGLSKGISKMDYSPHIRRPFYDDILSADDPYPVLASIRSGILQVRRSSGW